MATNTEKLGLKKPTQEDFYNVNDFSENFQKIDDFANRKDNPHGVTAKQTGAWGISSNGMTASGTDLNEMYVSGYYQMSAKCINTPTTANAGDILIIFPWDANSVLQIYSTTAKLWYRKALYGTSGTRNWGAWERLANLSEVLPLSGGTLTGQLLAINNGTGRLYADGANTAISACNEADDTSIRRTLFLNNSLYRANIAEALYLRDVKGGSGWADYRIFGEHNASELGVSRIQTGSYVGTGGYGVSGKSTLTFNFTPKIVFISAGNGGNSSVLFPFYYGENKAVTSYFPVTTTTVSSGYYNIALEWNNNSVSWYTSVNANNIAPLVQHNTSGLTYNWIAIG